MSVQPSHRNAFEFLLDGHDRPIETLWEQDFAHVSRRTPHYFDRILTLAEFDAIVAHNNFVFPSIQVFVAGRQLPPAEYTTPWRYGRQRPKLIVDMDRVFSHLETGATVNFLSLERLSPGIQDLNRAVEVASGFATHTTAFLSSPETDNIPAHFDMVDFFTIQKNDFNNRKINRCEQTS